MSTKSIVASVLAASALFAVTEHDASAFTAITSAMPPPRGASGSSTGTATTRGRIYLLDSGKPRALEIRVGLSDGAMSEVSGDGLIEGAEVIIGQQGASSPGAPAQKGSPPRMMF